MTDTQLEQLDHLHRKIGAALESHDYIEFTHTNRRFHFLIYDAAGSKYLSNVIAGLWDLAERYRYRYVFFKDQTTVIQAEHESIVEACHARDSKALREAIVFHMNQTLIGIRLVVEQNRQEKG